MSIFFYAIIYCIWNCDVFISMQSESKIYHKHSFYNNYKNILEWFFIFIFIYISLNIHFSNWMAKKNIMIYNYMLDYMPYYLRINF